jgi:hypothetical protein
MDPRQKDTYEEYLNAVREAALSKVAGFDDRALLEREAQEEADIVARAHAVFAPTLGDPSVGDPYAAGRSADGNPLTRIDLYIPLKLSGGDARLVGILLREYLGDLTLDEEKSRLVASYISEQPTAMAANEFFDASLEEARQRLAVLRERAEAFNNDLYLEILSAVQERRSLAEKHRELAKDLKYRR